MDGCILVSKYLLYPFLVVSTAYPQLRAIVKLDEPIAFVFLVGHIRKRNLHYIWDCAVPDTLFGMVESEPNNEVSCVWVLDSTKDYVSDNDECLARTASALQQGFFFVSHQPGSFRLLCGFPKVVHRLYLHTLSGY